MAHSDDHRSRNAPSSETDPGFEDRQEPRQATKERIPAQVEQRPGDEPIGNGQTGRPAAFPPHN